MDNFSRLNSSSPISSSPEKVWKIYKKRKTDDRRQRRNGKRDLHDSNDIDADKVQEENDVVKSDIKLDSGEYGLHGTAGSKKRSSRKVDVII